MPEKNIKLGMYKEFPKALFTVPNTETIRLEVNQYSVQNQKLKQSR